MLIMQDDNSKNSENLRKTIIQESDICVRCGLCLPHCPTYLVGKIEMESPRGRINMAEALSKNTVPLTESMQLHLNNCLGCLACEAMCPAKVPYHDLLIHTRELQYQGRPKPIPKLLAFLLDHLYLTPWLQRLFLLYQKTGLAWFFKKTKIAKLLKLSPYQDFMPKNPEVANFESFYPSKENKGNVALFIGCVNQLCDAKTIFHCKDLLNALGYNVHVPKSQACCGAIHLHNGDPNQARKYLQLNANIFEDCKVDAILTLATGCHSSFADIKNLTPKLANVPVIDANEFICQHANQQLQLFNHAKIILLHTPCSLKNSMKKPQLIAELLNAVGVNHYKQLEGYGCCGAAGLNMWNNPELANQLAKPLVEQIAAENADYVLTPNIGCQLHLQKQLIDRGLKTKVLHPLNLLKI
jgi:glycolate oxidase iron-sulfur subunit